MKRWTVQELRCVLYDYDALDKDDQIGEATIAIKDLKNQEEKDVWLDVNETHEKHSNKHQVCWQSHLQYRSSFGLVHSFIDLQFTSGVGLEIGDIQVHALASTTSCASEQGKEIEVAATPCVYRVQRGS